MKFKVGDKVRYISERPGQIITYTVDKVSDWGELGIMYYCKTPGIELGCSVIEESKLRAAKKKK